MRRSRFERVDAKVMVRRERQALKKQVKGWECEESGKLRTKGIWREVSGKRPPFIPCAGEEAMRPCSTGNYIFHDASSVKNLAKGTLRELQWLTVP